MNIADKLKQCDELLNATHKNLLSPRDFAHKEASRKLYDVLVLHQLIMKELLTCRGVPEPGFGSAMPELMRGE